MALFDPPHISMSKRLERSPKAAETYAAFEALVREALLAWPQRSSDLATGMIMAVWTRRAATEGLIGIPAAGLYQIGVLGRLCRLRMKPAEVAWTEDLMRHLMEPRLPN